MARNIAKALRYHIHAGWGMGIGGPAAEILLSPFTDDTIPKVDFHSALNYGLAGAAGTAGALMLKKYLARKKNHAHIEQAGITDYTGHVVDHVKNMTGEDVAGLVGGGIGGFMGSGWGTIPLSVGGDYLARNAYKGIHDLVSPPHVPTTLEKIQHLAEPVGRFFAEHPAVTNTSAGLAGAAGAAGLAMLYKHLKNKSMRKPHG